MQGVHYPEATATHLPVSVAYLILAHGKPQQLARLVSALPDSSPVLIHFDLRAPAAVYEEAVELLGSRPQLHFVRRAKCWWASYGIVRGTINLVQSLAALEVPYDYATLLSGSDYPIKANLDIARYLERNRGREFIESFLLTAPNRWSEEGGYSTAPRRVLGRHLHYRSRMIRLPGLRKMPAGLQPYGGSQWWTLSREAIRYIAEFIERRPKVVAFFKGCFAPDEAFIQTVISNSDLAGRITGDNLRIAVWGRPQPPYPATLTMDDQYMLRASKQHFARKFDPEVDSRILDLLDQWRLRHEAAATTGAGESIAAMAIPPRHGERVHRSQRN